MKGSSTRRRKARASPSPFLESPIAHIRRALFASPDLHYPKSTAIPAKTRTRAWKASAGDGEAPAVSRKEKASPHAGDEKQMKSVEDVKGFFYSKMEKVKHCVDLSHSAILKDFDASHARLQKRLKGHVQICQEVMAEVDGEYQKVSAQMSENRKATKATFAEFVHAAESNSSHVSKVSIKDLSHSWEKNLDVLCQKFGIPPLK
ncbi:hypothetical protein MLD38_010452 [Melastoma candidum]|uniref:Uncharacterized protein n=1 Tax=Melastoma candidum TaxID=119954 RepID=A0ACB9R878_9MYRT|nr:hypothetical protein MLD38_010452 [Melastoma candidum]